jgi:molybdenum cofactor biosynthesis enzyme MoaA
MISLDAGTPETYAKIKGRPVFQRVVANVVRYTQANAGRVILKMILSEQNMHEVSQFLDIALHSGVRIVCYDTPMFHAQTNDSVVEAAAFFCKEAARRGLECRVGEVGSIYNTKDGVTDRVGQMRGLLDRSSADVGFG